MSKSNTFENDFLLLVFRSCLRRPAAGAAVARFRCRSAGDRSASTTKS